MADSTVEGSNRQAEASERSSAPSAPSELRRSGKSAHALRYWLLLVTRRRRPLLEGAVAERAEALLREAAVDAGCEVLDVSVRARSVVLHLDADPLVAPAELAGRLRRRTAERLMAEFDHLLPEQAVWARAFVATTRPLTAEEIESFLLEVPLR